MNSTAADRLVEVVNQAVEDATSRITSYNVCYTKLLRLLATCPVQQLRVGGGSRIVPAREGSGSRPGGQR